MAPEVERTVTPAHVPVEERSCALCGQLKKVIGFVEHQCIRFVPAKIVVDAKRREKPACEYCRKDVSVAPRSVSPSVVRRVDASLLAKLVTEKCSLALPSTVSGANSARLGLDVPGKTLQSYWSYTADLIEPVAAYSDRIRLASRGHSITDPAPSDW